MFTQLLDFVSCIIYVNDEEVLRDAVLVDLLVYLRRESNGAHNTISKLLVYNPLEGVTIVLHNLIKSVN